LPMTEGGARAAWRAGTTQHKAGHDGGGRSIDRYRRKSPIVEIVTVAIDRGSERAFATLQDRLPKERRLAGLGEIEAASAIPFFRHGLAFH